MSKFDYNFVRGGKIIGSMSCESYYDRSSETSIFFVSTEAILKKLDIDCDFRVLGVKFQKNDPEKILKCISNNFALHFLQGCFFVKPIEPFFVIPKIMTELLWQLCCNNVCSFEIYFNILRHLDCQTDMLTFKSMF
jgi:hypothetical protein